MVRWEKQADSHNGGVMEDKGEERARERKKRKGVRQTMEKKDRDVQRRQRGILRSGHGATSLLAPPPPGTTVNTGGSWMKRGNVIQKGARLQKKGVPLGGREGWFRQQPRVTEE